MIISEEYQKRLNCQKNANKNLEDLNTSYETELAAARTEIEIHYEHAFSQALKMQEAADESVTSYLAQVSQASTFNIWWVRDAIKAILANLTGEEMQTGLAFVKNNTNTYEKALLLYTKKAEVHLGLDSVHYKVLSEDDLKLLTSRGDVVVLDLNPAYELNYATPTKTFYNAGNKSLTVQKVRFGVYDEVLTKFIETLVKASMTSTDVLTQEDVMRVKDEFIKENVIQAKRSRKNNATIN